MVEIVGVRFKKAGKVYYFDPDGITAVKNQQLIVETSRGIEMGETVVVNKMVEEDCIVMPLKKVLRAATEEDVRIAESNAVREREAFDICEKKIADHKLDMKLVDVEFTFDTNKILFYFTADGRVDFRELVKDLASVFRTRIELRQIGVRDESKMIGGLGSFCGRPLCCSTFLDEFHPVSIKMAKEQNLSLNPVKISGTCGRLMCCLKYEQEAYEDLIRTSPKQGATVITPQGRGFVEEVSLIRRTVKVRLEDQSEPGLKLYKVRELKTTAGERFGGDGDEFEQPASEPAVQNENERTPRHAERKPTRERPQYDETEVVENTQDDRARSGQRRGGQRFGRRGQGQNPQGKPKK